MIFSIFLPRAAMVSVTVCVIIAVAIIPMVYSYGIYKISYKVFFKNTFTWTAGFSF